MNSKLAVSLALSALMACAAPAHAQCPGAKSPADFCTSARALSGNAGVQLVHVNATTATAPGEQVCGVNVGHSVWFSMVPGVSGLLTFSTCHPLTTFDTVAEAFVGGDSGCEFMMPVQCNDDTPTAACSNGCSAYGSTLRFDVTAGQLYRFRVGSYNNNSAGCTLCLGVLVTLCGSDATPPEAAISSPSALACICPGSVPITGTVNDTDSGIASYVVDVAPVAGGPWTVIGSGMGNIVGNLATWNTAGLADADYYVRLTARDGCDNVATTIVTVRIDAAFDSLTLRSPTDGAILGGIVYADGTAWDRCGPGSLLVEWAPVGGAYTSFSTLSTPWIITDPLGTWSTRPGVPDGNYNIRLSANTACAARTLRDVAVAIDNTPPTALITSPISCTLQAPGSLQIRGTANDAHLASWVLQYTGGDAPVWVTIATGFSPVINGVLATWDTRGLRECQYTVRLVVTDAAVIDNNGALHNRTETSVTFELGTGCTQDYNGDGIVNSQDFFDFLTIFFNGCP